MGDAVSRSFMMAVRAFLHGVRLRITSERVTASVCPWIDEHHQTLCALDMHYDVSPSATAPSSTNRVLTAVAACRQPMPSRGAARRGMPSLERLTLCIQNAWIAIPGLTAALVELPRLCTLTGPGTAHGLIRISRSA